METNLRLHYRCTLETNLQDACLFHTDTHNLPLITPPWIKVEIISMESPMREKSIVRLKIKRFGFPTLWTMQIATLNCPHSVVDEMLSGPFKTFRHERFFSIRDETTTQMEETITFSLPLGWLGRLLLPLIKRDMDKMFAFRHHATQHYFLRESV